MAFPRQAMVLAAGKGTRLGELGKRTAKALVEIGGEPLLAHQLRYLAALGVERVVVNASHLAEQVEEFAAGYEGPPQLRVSREDEPIGTAGGVLRAFDLFAPEPLLVLYGDVVSGEDLRPMGEEHSGGDAVATLAVYRSEEADQKGVVDLDGARITAFHEKDPARTSGWVNAGIYVVEHDWLATQPRDVFLDFGHDLFPEALANGRELRAHKLERPLLDVGTPDDLALARERGLPPPP